MYVCIYEKCDITYLDPDQKYIDSGYIVELYLPVCHMLEVGESILILEKPQQTLYI